VKRIIIVLLLTVFSSSLASAVEQTSSDNYIIEQPSFSGGSNTSDSDNFSTRGTVGDTSDLGLESDNYSLDATEAASRQADVLPKPTLENDNDYFDRLRITIDEQDNPSDTKYAIAISKDNFSTFSYVQQDLTIGSSLSSEDWLIFAELGEADGELIIGLDENTSYKVRVAAFHGDFSTTRYSATSDEATTSSSYLRLSSDKESCSLGTLTELATATCNYNLSFSSNYYGGLKITTSGSTLTSGGNKIEAIGSTAVASQTGIEQFGFNAKANSNPAVGQEPVGSNITINNPFTTKDLFAFSENIEQDTLTTDSITATSTSTISIIVNAASDTEPGSYQTTITHTIYAN